MNMLRIIWMVINFLNRLCSEYVRKKHIEHGERIAIRKAKELQRKRIYKARKARLAVRNRVNSGMRKDHYRRD